MSLNDHFYHSTLRKYIIGFGTLFNGITVKRGTEEAPEFISVPISYGSKQKWFARLQANPNLDKPQAVTLPRLSFIITNVMYDTERKCSSIGQMNRIDYTDNTKAKRIFYPVPYNIMIALTVYAKNMDDYLQIFEQILPFFKPDFSLTIKDIEGIDVLKDVPIILDDIAMIHDSEGSMDEYRVINSDLNFTIKGNFYGPLNFRPLIKNVIINHRVGHKKFDDPEADIDIKYKAKPDPDTAFADDDYGFTEEWEYNVEPEDD